MLSGGEGEELVEEQTPSIIEEKEQKILNIIIKQQKDRQTFNPKEAARLLAERERLRFHCDNCGLEWMKIRPDNHVIRCGDNTNFYIGTGDEDGIRTYIYCPGCGKYEKIRRLPVMKISSQPVRKRVFRPVFDEDNYY